MVPPEESLVGPAESTKDRLVSIGLFLLTLLSVYWVYGTQWMGGSPFSDPAVALGSARFAAGLMGILLAHEMGHYLVARAHGFQLSLPYFLPLPAAFGTMGAIIRLRSLPRSRTGLLEMGAAGPLAGFAVALVLMALGISSTEEHAAPVLVVESAEALAALFQVAVPVGGAAEGWTTLPPFSWILPPVSEVRSIPLLIMANPPVLDGLGMLINGQVPGRYASLDPLAMAGWVGCLVTAINLLPIGQLDGGHILNAMLPRWAPRIARIGVGLALLGGLFWTGWAVWAILLLVLRAWRSLPVPLYPPPSSRSRVIGLLSLLTFLLCFMPRPLEIENLPLEKLLFVDLEGRPLLAPASP